MLQFKAEKLQCFDNVSIYWACIEIYPPHAWWINFTYNFW